MLQNYFKIAIRSLWKHKAFSAINIIGLSASMAVCLLIILMLNDQYSFDSYNEQKERVFRIITDQKTQGGHISSFATAPANLAAQLKIEATWAEKITIIRRAEIMVNTGAESVALSGFYTDTDFFDVFDKQLSAGNISAALSEPNTIVLSHETAEQLFGTKNPIGELLTLESKTGKALGQLTISGVLNKQVERSHLSYESLISFATLQSFTENEEYTDLDNWFNLNEFWIYTLLKPQYDLNAVQNSLDKIAQASCQRVGIFPHLSFNPQALRAINPAKISLANSPRPAIPIWIMYFFAGLATILLLLACFNYASLSLARSLQRAKEVGIRKVVGAFRRQIVGQFLAESIVISLLALVVAVGLLQLLLPGFNKLDAEVKDIFHFEFDTTIFVWFVVFAISTGLLAGLSPAIILSRFQPVATLRKLANLKVFSYITIRKGLIVLQFAVSLIFIITLVTLNRQFNYTMEADLGYETKNILNINLQNHPYQPFQQIISQYKDATAVSASSMVLATNTGSWLRAKLGKKDSLDLPYIAVDEHFIPAVEIKLLAGRNFDDVDSSHTEKSIILNETAVKELRLGTPQDAIGQFLSLSTGRSVEIIGVVNDFAYMELKGNILPVVLRNVANEFNFINIRLSGFETPAALKYFETAWKKIDTKNAFQYQFHDDALAYANSDLTILGKIIGVAGGIAIIIACMGLLGMVIYTTEARRKEVSIRKVLGAEVRSLVFLLSSSFLQLMLIAVLIGAPVAYLINNSWLQNYTYRINLGLGILSFSSLLLLGIAFVTIGSQVFRAATAKPITHLNTE